jgi:hypothetical protein
MRFSRHVVGAFPDNLLQDLIAHELAHVLQWAVGRDMDGEDDLDVELEANELIESWGFDAYEMDDWLEANGPLRAIDSISKSE